MKYTNIIKLYNKYTLSNSILIKLNLWSFLNLRYFLFKSTSFLFYFLTNMSKYKIKFLKINNYTNFNVLLILLVLLFVFFILLLL